MFLFKGWFGLRQDACGWILHLCPIFETYANIEYHFPTLNSASSLHNIDSTRSNPSIISAGQRNRNISSTRRFFFRKKPSKTDHSENELLQTVILTPLNILKLHEPD
jgi:hypothetical protein